MTDTGNVIQIHEPLCGAMMQIQTDVNNHLDTC
jgi:hypothetical protein